MHQFDSGYSHMSKKIDYDKAIKHPLCMGSKTTTMDGTEYDCEYGSSVECDKCRFLLVNRGRGKDPRAKINNQ